MPGTSRVPLRRVLSPVPSTVRSGRYNRPMTLAAGGEAERTRRSPPLWEGRPDDVSPCVELARTSLECAGRLYLHGAGPLRHLASYAIERLRQADGQPPIAARPLLPFAWPSADVSEAAAAFAQPGDTILFLAAENHEGLEQAIRLARSRRARAVSFLGPRAAELAGGCDGALVLVGDGPAAVAEACLSALHAFVAGLLARPVDALPGSGEPRDGVPGQESAAPAGVGPALLSLAPSSDSRGPQPFGDEAEGYSPAPPTNPRGVGRRRAGAAPGGQFRLRCPSCGEVVLVEERHVGRKGQCPECECKFRIPAPPPGGSEPLEVGFDAIESEAPVHLAPTRRVRNRTRRERRRSSRFRVKDALVRFGREGYPDESSYFPPYLLEDLSLTGLRFVGRCSGLEIGDVRYFAVDFPAFPSPVRFKGEVRRLIPVSEGQAAGVRFLEYVGDAEAKIRRLLEEDRLRNVRRR
ncbi:MAG: PilZ domain-containing protein [Planctomycetota bacterium]|nr:MAG: PilZ domain-containing protein [Planctomycetota bacterium]